jgi:hypothetical protein
MPEIPCICCFEEILLDLTLGTRCFLLSLQFELIRKNVLSSFGLDCEGEEIGQVFFLFKHSFRSRSSGSSM